MRGISSHDDFHNHHSHWGLLRLLLRRLLPSCFFRDAVVVIGLAQGQHKNRWTQCTQPCNHCTNWEKGSIPSLALRSGEFLPWRHRLCWSLKHWQIVTDGCRSNQTDQHHSTSHSPNRPARLTREDISGTCESLSKGNYLNPPTPQQLQYASNTVPSILVIFSLANLIQRLKLQIDSFNRNTDLDSNSNFFHELNKSENATCTAKAVHCRERFAAR